MNQPEWLTEEFVAAVFGQSASKSDCQLELAVPEGDNFLSDIYRVTNGSQSYIVKMRPTGAIKVIVENLAAFEKESMMYDFLEDIEKITGQRLGPKRIIYNDLIVLEDLKASGYTVEDRRKQLGLDHSKRAMECMAKLHAASYIILKDQTKRNKYELLRKEIYFTSAKNAVIHSVAPLMNQLVNEINGWSEISHLAEKLQIYMATFFDRCSNEILAGSNCGFMSHGDFHTNNIMFNESLDSLVIDFQFSRENKPVLDIIMFMMTSIRLEVRAAYMEQLLQLYCETFNSSLSSFDISLSVTPEDIKKDLSNVTHFTFYVTVMRTALVLAESSKEIKENSLLPSSATNLFKNETYKKILISLIQEFDSKGLFDL